MSTLKRNDQNEKEIRKFKIYAHINKSNGKIYIGQTCRDVEYCWNDGKGYVGCHHFWNAIKKHGNKYSDLEIYLESIGAVRVECDKKRSRWKYNIEKLIDEMHL